MIKRQLEMDDFLRVHTFVYVAVHMQEHQQHTKLLDLLPKVSITSRQLQGSKAQRNYDVVTAGMNH